MKLSDCPSDWTLMRLSEVFEVQLGKMLSAKARGGISPKPYLRNKNVQWGSVDIKEMIEMDFNEREAEKFHLRNGDLLMCEGGVPGRTAIWRDEIAECYYQKAIHRLRPLNGQALPEFFLYWFRYAFDITNVYGISGASSTIAHLPAAQLRALSVPVPAMDEQRRIAAVLSAVQRAIERQERLIALTAELKKALMHKLFTEGTRGEPLKHTEIGPVPESWRIEPLGQHLTAAQYGLSVKGAADGKTPILRMTNQVEGRIVVNDLQMVNIDDADRLKFKVELRDILFNRTNSFDLVGRTAIFELEGEFVFASYLIRLRTNANILRPAFLNHYFNWSAVQARLKGIASRAVSQSNISASRLRGFVVALPSPEEQDEIGRCIDQVDRVRAVRQRQLGVLQDLFRTLLHQLMTAQIRIHDLDLTALGFDSEKTELQEVA